VGKSHEEREALLDRVEDCMLRGFDRPAQVRQMVEGIGDDRTAKAYIRLVRNRWKRSGARNVETERQKLIAGKQLVERMAWVARADANSVNEQVGALRTVLEAQKQKAQLLGLDVQKFEVSGEINGRLKIEPEYDEAELAEWERVLLERVETQAGKTGEGDKVPADAGATGSEPSGVLRVPGTQPDPGGTPPTVD